MKKQINVLRSEDNNLITGSKEILAYCNEFFQRIHSSRDAGNRDHQQERSSLCDQFLGDIECPQLDAAGRNICEAPISGFECKQALKSMINNKAPSVSGFSKEFFLYFWDDLETVILNYLAETKENGKFFVTQRRGVITLIPKRGDQTLLKNKRAICLLDTLYKVVAKVIANRLMLVISKLVSPDQTGSIRGRHIGMSIRTIADVIEYCEADNLGGIIMALDFRNAFNTVEHEFIYDMLLIY